MVLEDIVIRDCYGPAVTIMHQVVEAEASEVDSEERQAPRETTVTFRNVRFVDNEDLGEYSYLRAFVDGGALQVTASTLAIIEYCEFENNGAELGGAIRVDGGSVEVFRSLFVENKASISGGAISASASSPTGESTSRLIIKETTFLRNEDLQGGEDTTGLILHNGAPLETSEFLSFPSPQSSGGALYFKGFKEVEIESCVFDGNTGNPAAGAMFISDNDRVKLLNNTFRNNVAQSHPKRQRQADLEQGGAVYVAFTRSESTIEIIKCNFENNTASYGGGLMMVMPLVAVALIEDCRFTDNTAHLGGGGFVLRNAIQVRLSLLQCLNPLVTDCM